REVTVPSGAIGFIDLMYVDKEGLITIVETKLIKNPEIRRTVIGQIIEYASFVSQWTADNIYEIAAAYLKQTLTERMKGCANEFSDDDFKNNIEDNLQNGKMRLIIAADELDESLRATVTFLNSHSNFDILLLQVSSFEESKAKKVIIPKLFGYATKSGKPRPPKKPWNLELFLADAETRRSKEKVAVIRKLIDFTTAHSEGGILWGQGRTYGTFSFRKQVDGISTTIFYVYSDGTFFINFGPLKNKGVNKDILESFRMNLNKIPNVKLREEVVVEDDKYPSMALTPLENPENFKLFEIAILSLCQQIDSKEHKS
ncbi:MAG: hypothetical protein V1823_04425, partial [Chloroflexota bacterium]